MSTPERPPTPTARLHEVTMAFANRAQAPPESSVTISRNAKGAFQFEVTVRGENAQDCKVTADQITKQLVAAYPYPVET